jgi:hypothetical protein
MVLARRIIFSGAEDMKAQAYYPRARTIYVPPLFIFLPPFVSWHPGSLYEDEG